jgi:endo-1,4-beta-D-glucanase Y
MGLVPKSKLFALSGIVLVYLLLGVVFHTLVSNGTITRLAPTATGSGGNDTAEFVAPTDVRFNLNAAQQFLDSHLVEDIGHIDLYWFVQGAKAEETTYYNQHNHTNSEAISYALLIAAQAHDKTAFDHELDYVEDYMLEPHFGYLMWRLDDRDRAQGEGTNIAPDADLRAIKALMIAQEQWGDSRYTRLIDQLAEGLEKVALTDDNYLAGYGGVSGPSATWTANEVWLSYSDFSVFAYLAQTRGEPWQSVYTNMKTATLNAQIHNGLYNQQLTEARAYGNGLDDGGYSINSMWIMVRNAESGDAELMQSALTSLLFYRERYATDAELYTKYDSTGNALSSGDAPWVYALVGRAAVALNDDEFADQMIEELISKQITNETNELHGALLEGGGLDTRVGQFTMQESIITLQDYLEHKGRYP